MADGRSYGDYLREARERKGIDLVSMARTLHIRPDIVGAIEHADFNKMPAHGYTKNMVRAYARHVGLNESQISQMYTEERERHDAPHAPSRSSSSDRTGRSEARSRRLDSPSRRIPAERSERSASRSQSISRRVDDAPSRSRSSTKREGSFSELVASVSNRSSQRGSMVRTSFTQGGMQSSLGQQPKRGLGAATRSLPAINLPVILAIAGAIIVIIIAVVLFNGGKQSVDDVPDIPISGLTDTSDADEGTEAPQLATAPSSVVFSFSVADGGQSWISVYLDGSDTPVYAQVAEGPLTQDFEVTGTLRFETANIAPITLTVDGEEVTATADSSGVYVYTVDFPSFLAEWKQAHGVEGGSKTDDEGTTSNTTSTSDASNDSSSSTNTSASSNTSSTSR